MGRMKPNVQTGYIFWSGRLLDGIGNGKLVTAVEYSVCEKLFASPCAACKILRRRCAEKCVFAPYFPPNEPHKFATAHRVFGASNIVKMIKDLPSDRRADAVSSMVYEANARLRDPVYGCAGTVCQLQHQISQLQSQLAGAQAELVNLRLQDDNFVSILSALGICGEAEHFSSAGSISEDKDTDTMDSILFK